MVCVRIVYGFGRAAYAHKRIIDIIMYALNGPSRLRVCGAFCGLSILWLGNVVPRIENACRQQPVCWFMERAFADKHTCGKITNGSQVYTPLRCCGLHRAQHDLRAVTKTTATAAAPARLANPPGKIACLPICLPYTTCLFVLLPVARFDCAFFVVG